MPDWRARRGRTKMETVALCKSAYAETRQLYGFHASALGGSALGYRILYGPPFEEPEILFVGDQPGGGETAASESARLGHLESWPSECDFANAEWRLAKRMREIWSPEFLATCVAMNANFFRAPSSAAWSQVRSESRQALEMLSLRWCERIAEAIRPRQVIIIGFRTFRRLTAGTPVVIGRRGPLAFSGQLWSAPTTGIMHLSGARISAADRRSLATHLNPDGY